jgi:hypothetical protein
MNTRAERRRAERAICKEAGRAARWLEAIPEPTMAAARRLARPRAGLRRAGGAHRGVGAQPSGAGLGDHHRGRRHRNHGGVIGARRGPGRRGGASRVGHGGRGRYRASTPPVPLTKKGVKAFNETVWTIADKSGHSVEQVTLGLCDLLTSGGAVIDEHGKVSLLPEPPSAGGGGPDTDALAEAVRATIRIGPSSRARSGRSRASAPLAEAARSVESSALREPTARLRFSFGRGCRVDVPRRHAGRPASGEFLRRRRHGPSPQQCRDPRRGGQYAERDRPEQAARHRQRP